MKDQEFIALISLLDDPDPGIFNHVQEKVMSLGATSLPLLIDYDTSTESDLFKKRINELILDIHIDELKREFEDWRDSPKKSLLTGMTLVAKFENPLLTEYGINQLVSQLYYQIWLDVDTSSYPTDLIRNFNYSFFQKLKFRGNVDDFFNPDNSMIDKVMETRLGNPISLSVLYLFLAKRLNLPIHGVNLPNIFVLLFEDENSSFYINVYKEGSIFSKFDIDNYIKEIGMPLKESFYRPCSNIDIVVRSLRNLKICYSRAGNNFKAQKIEHILAVVLRED